MPLQLTRPMMNSNEIVTPATAPISAMPILDLVTLDGGSGAAVSASSEATLVPTFTQDADTIAISLPPEVTLTPKTVDAGRDEVPSNPLAPVPADLAATARSIGPLPRYEGGEHGVEDERHEGEQLGNDQRDIEGHPVGMVQNSGAATEPPRSSVPNGAAASSDGGSGKSIAPLPRTSGTPWRKLEAPSTKRKPRRPEQKIHQFEFTHALMARENTGVATRSSAKSEMEVTS